MSSLSLEEQVKIVIRLLEGKSFERDSKHFKKALEWVERFPREVPTTLEHRLRAAFKKSFGVTDGELAAYIAGRETEVAAAVADQTGDREAKLREILPRAGWFEWYDNYTRETEAPLSYHIFSSMCVLSAMMGRKVWIDMGFFRIYPMMRVVLIGSPGRLKKTAATDIATDLIRQLAPCPILPDKITPERLVTRLTKEGGYQYLCAEEMAFFFGRQEYNRGLIPLMLKILTDRETIEVETQSRELELISGLAVTFLAGTTPSLLANSMPGEVTSTGFLSRLVLVYEADTFRCFDIPRKGMNEDRIIRAARRVGDYAGEAKLTSAASVYHHEWYQKLWQALRDASDEIESDMLSRTQIHMLRAALIMHLVQCDNLRICEDCLRRASQLIDFTIENSPTLIRSLKQTGVSADAEYVLSVLVRAGGALDHSTLLRRCGTRMNAQQFKQHIRTLEESGRIEHTKRGTGTIYNITGVKDAVD